MENKQSILVIDDSPTVRRLAELVLSQEGYDVYTSEDGEDGLKLAKKETPSVIIVDFIMPKMNGYDFCKIIRSDSVLNNIPIVLITSKGKDVGQGFDKKFDIVQYLQKPFEAETLITTVKEALANREEEPGAADEVIAEHAAAEVETDSQMPLQTYAAPEDSSFVEITPTETANAEDHAEEALPEETPANREEEPGVADEEVTEHAVAEVETDSQMPLQTYAAPEDSSFVEITPTETANAEDHAEEALPEETPANREEESGVADEEVTEHAAAEVETDSQAPLQTNAAPEDSSFVEIMPTETGNAEDHATEALPEHADTVPAETPSIENEPAVYAALQENIKKEFRHYFGRELTVLLKNTMIQSLKETDLVRSSRRILSGEIVYISIDDVMKFISMSSLSGKLSVLTDSFNSEIYLESGQIAFASISRHDCGICLEELILKDGDPRRGEILSALSEAGGNNLTAGDILLDRGLINEEELTDCYRHLSEDAVKQTLSATSGHFYIEDVPLPREIQDIKLKIPANEARG
ncbi:MAG TPA: response regulator [Nitrospirae bacterium]|nr:response regulator [Nitrospirota bacterium]